MEKAISEKTIMEKIVVKAIRFHDLRHTHATILLGRNIHPKVVSERLGHASIRITLDTYSHVLPTMQQTVVDALGDLGQSSSQKKPGKRRSPAKLPGKAKKTVSDTPRKMKKTLTL